MERAMSSAARMKINNLYCQISALTSFVPHFDFEFTFVYWYLNKEFSDPGSVFAWISVLEVSVVSVENNEF